MGSGPSPSGPKLPRQAPACGQFLFPLGKTLERASRHQEQKYKKKKFCLTLLVFTAVVTTGVQAASISSTIATINADANRPGGPEKALKSISASTHVPVATLEKQKAKSGLTYGELYIALSISNASGKSFEKRSMKTKGQSGTRSPTPTT